MKVKKVNQYKCDFCGKKNYSAGHMRSHEKHCTMNPGRCCRMCDKAGGHMFNMSELLEMLPEKKERVMESEFGFDTCSIENIEEINQAIDLLYDKVERCPACVLATIRQKGIPVPATKFDFKKELNSFWSDYNDDHCEQYIYW